MYLADPSRGNIRMPSSTFLRDWLQSDGRGIIFVAEPSAGPPGRSALTLGDPPSPPEHMTIQELMSVGSFAGLREDLAR